MFFVEKYFNGWDPKIHAPRKYLQSFYVYAFIDKYGTTKNHSLEMFQNSTSKKIGSSVTGKTDNEITSSSSDYVMKSKKRKNICATFKIQMITNCLSLYAKDDVLFNIRSKIPAFALKPLKAMWNLVVDRIFLQQLEYEIERADLPDDYVFLKLDIVVTLPSLTYKFNFRKPLN